MSKILDYYFLTLSRAYCYKLDYRATGFMMLSFMVNVFSLIVLFVPRILDQSTFWIIYIIIGIVVAIVLDIIYNDRRRERIKEKYKEESINCQNRIVTMVIWYEVLTFAFLVFAIWTLVR